ncbi:hypothetical protein T12_14523, partial [Trichinella patagoniensis]
MVQFGPYFDLVFLLVLERAILLDLCAVVLLFILLKWTVNKNEEKHAIDEQMIPFTPRKPRRWEFKLFSRCGISEMHYDFLFYVLCRPKVEKSFGFVPADFAMKLCEHLPKQQNHKLFSDNYFNFIEFQPCLKEQGIWTR